MHNRQKWRKGENTRPIIVLQNPIEKEHEKLAVKPVRRRTRFGFGTWSFLFFHLSSILFSCSSFVSREGMCISSRRRQTHLICKLCEKNELEICNFHLLAFCIISITSQLIRIKRNTDECCGDFWQHRAPSISFFNNWNKIVQRFLKFPILFVTRTDGIGLTQTTAWFQSFSANISLIFLSFFLYIYYKPQQYIMTWASARYMRKEMERWNKSYFNKRRERAQLY